MKRSTTYSSLLLVIFLSISYISFSQNNQRKPTAEQKEKIEARRVAYITDKLDLSVEEAQKFWPVYNANRDKIDKERKAFRKENDLLSDDITKMTDEEALALLDERLEFEQKLLNFKSEYNNELKKVISPQKILLLIEAEKEFREQLIRQVSRERNSRNKGL